MSIFSIDKGYPIGTKCAKEVEAPLKQVIADMVSR